MFMFGTLTVHQPEDFSLGQRSALRLRPEKGLSRGRGLYRMTLFAWTEVTLPLQWKDALREKRMSDALDWLRAQGVRELVTPPAWQTLARERGLAPLNSRRALEACAGTAVAEGCRGLGLTTGEVGLAVYGRAISGPVHTELLSLARRVRTIRIYGENNEDLRTKLWRGCGIVDRGPMPRELPVIALVLEGGLPPENALLTIDLTGREGEARPGLWRPRLLPPPGALAQLPRGVPAEAFAAALFTVGALQSREIHVSRLDIEQDTQYNKETANNC